MVQHFDRTPQPKMGLQAKLDNGVMDSAVFDHKIKLAEDYRQLNNPKYYNKLYKTI